MLQDINAHVASCLHRAAGIRALPRTAGSAVRGLFLHLGHSSTLSGRLNSFTHPRGVFSANQRDPALKTRSAKVPAPHKADRNTGRIENALVAIIDDDQCAREGINSLISSLGYSSATFMSAEDYLGSDFKLSTACLILDVHLPGMSGPDLQAHLIADGGSTPIVFVTGLFDQRVRDRVIDAGALAYLTKPCDENALISCLATALGS